MLSPIPTPTLLPLPQLDGGGGDEGLARVPLDDVGTVDWSIVRPVTSNQSHHCQLPCLTDGNGLQYVIQTPLGGVDPLTLDNTPSSDLKPDSF